MHVFYYITLILSLLVFAFRHSTARTFFLTLLSGVVLSVLTAILVGLTNFNEITVLSLLLGYYLVFGLFAYTGAAGKMRKAFAGIAINLFYWMTPFIPLVITGLYYAILRRERWKLTEEQQYAYLKNESLHYQVAEIAGFLLMLVLLEPVFKYLYRKWYSLPEQ